MSKVIELGDALMALTTAEAIELQNYLETKGLKPVAAPVTVTTTALETVKEELSANVNIVVTDKGSLTTISLVRPIMKIIGKSATETKKLIDVLPAIILEQTPRETANGIVSDLINEVGDQIKIELQDC